MSGVRTSSVVGDETLDLPLQRLRDHVVVAQAAEALPALVDEAVVTARLRAADPEAFDIVYDQFNARLFNFLARLSRRRDVAEDLLEETWLRFVAQMPRLRGDTRLGAWLFTVAGTWGVSAGYAEHTVALPPGRILDTTGTPLHAQWLWFDPTNLANHGSTAGQRFQIR